MNNSEPITKEEEFPEGLSLPVSTIKMAEIPSTRWGVRGKQLLPETNLGIRNIYLIAAQQYIEYCNSKLSQPKI